ncbi:MAG: hypothetical protein ABI823_17535, partial [Bryobacteraceae bacterium]
ICNALPTPRPANCPAVGFQASIDTATPGLGLANGPHTIQVRVRDEIGRFFNFPEAPVPFTVKHDAFAPPIGKITAPVANAELSGTVTVDGYAYSPQTGGRIAGVFVFLDSEQIGTATYGIARPEDCATLTGVAACPNIGFRYTLDTKRFSNGAHQLYVYLADQDFNLTFVGDYYGGTNVTIKN